MPDSTLRRLLCAAIESFPINRERKERLLRALLKENREKE